VHKQAATVGEQLGRQLIQAARAGGVHPMEVEGMGQQAAANVLERFVDLGSLTRDQARVLHTHLQREIGKAQPTAEEFALAQRSQAFAPTRASEIAMTGGMGVGGIMGMDRAMRALTLMQGKVPEAVPAGGWADPRPSHKPLSAKGAIKEMFVSPYAVAFPAAVEAAGILASPIGDPRYRRGDIGYTQSAGEHFGRQIQDLSRKTGDTYKKWSVLAPAISAMHGTFNPLSSLGYLGRSIGRLGKGIGHKTGLVDLEEKSSADRFRELTQKSAATAAEKPTFSNRLRALVLGVDPLTLQKAQKDLETYARLRGSVAGALKHVGVDI
jgi:hypothetical protein